MPKVDRTEAVIKLVQIEGLSFERIDGQSDKKKIVFPTVNRRSCQAISNIVDKV